MMEETQKDITSIKFPEDSGEVTLRYGVNQQSPISIGDFISLKLKKTRNNGFNTIDLIVSEFQRNDQGQVTHIKGYSVNSRHLNEIQRDGENRPIRVVSGGKTYELPGSENLEVIGLDEINRLDENSKFLLGSSFKDSYKQPASAKREKFSFSRRWYQSAARDASVQQDSGSFMLRIGAQNIATKNGTAFKAPITPGDEVFMRIKKPGTLLGFDYERVLVESIIYEDNKAIGLTGTRVGGGAEEYEWQFKSIDFDTSYIEDNPWSGDRANAIPGGFNKRQEFTPKSFGFDDFSTLFNSFFGSKDKHRNQTDEEIKDLFGYRYGSTIDTQTIKPWEDKPIKYDEWLEINKIANHSEAKLLWAYWVLQVDPDSTMADVKSAYGKLSKRFHPDRMGDEEAMKAANLAYHLVKKYHSKL